MTLSIMLLVSLSMMAQGGGTLPDGGGNTGGGVTLVAVVAVPTWVLDSNANVDKLTINKGGKVVLNGHTLNYSTLSNNGTLDTTTTGLTYTQTVSGIENVMNDRVATTDDDAIYDLSGRRIPTVATGGIYIRNGRKIVISR